MNESEAPNTVHGRLLESVHLSGYSFERACAELEWLLDDDRWKSVGAGYEDINAFLDSMNFSELRVAVDQRKRLAKRLQEIEATQRATARLLGVGLGTINRDVSVPSGTTQAETYENTQEDRTPKSQPVPSGTPAWFQSDADPSTEATRRRRQANRISVAARARAQADLPAAKFRVVYADPPWSYNDKADAGSVQSGGAEQHYPSMSIAELCALPVPTICEPNAVLFLWVTSPLLFECKAVIEAWGFTYKSSFVWDKHAHNMGHYNSVRHEFLLVCTRGSCPPDVPKLFDSVQRIGRTDHSEKPGFFRLMIDTLYPHGKRVELFAREAVDGWTAWGNEVGRDHVVDEVRHEGLA